MKTAKNKSPGKEIVFSGKKAVRRLLFAFLSISSGLFFLDTFFSSPGSTWDEGIRNVFNLTREDGLGNWYASTLWFSIALVVWVLAVRLRAEGNRHAGVWTAMAGLFSYAAIDDGSRIHESFGGAFQRGVAAAEWFPTYHWHLLFGPIFAVLAALIVYIAAKGTKNRFARWVLLGGLACLVCAVGLDSLEGLAKYQWFAWAEFVNSDHPQSRHLLKTIEETIETAGLGLILTGFLSHTASTFPHWKIQIKS